MFLRSELAVKKKLSCNPQETALLWIHPKTVFLPSDVSSRKASHFRRFESKLLPDNEEKYI